MQIAVATGPRPGARRSPSARAHGSWCCPPATKLNEAGTPLVPRADWDSTVHDRRRRPRGGVAVALRHSVDAQTRAGVLLP